MNCRALLPFDENNQKDADYLLATVEHSPDVLLLQYRATVLQWTRHSIAATRGHLCTGLVTR